MLHAVGDLLAAGDGVFQAGEMRRTSPPASGGRTESLSIRMRLVSVRNLPVLMQSSTSWASASSRSR